MPYRPKPRKPNNLICPARKVCALAVCPHRERHRSRMLETPCESYPCPYRGANATGPITCKEGA